MTAFDAMRHFWWLLILLALAGAGAGVAYGLSRDASYVAETRLSVGRIDVSTQTIPSFTTAAVSLADTYSRAIVASQVIARIEQQTDLPAQEALERVSASPIPETSTVSVFAEAGSSARAVKLANASARVLVGYVRKLNRFNPDSDQLLQRYGDAVEAFTEARAARARSGTSPETQAELLTAKLELQTAASLYTTSQQGQASTNTLQVLALAADAEDDGSETTQQAAFVGAIAGLLFGMLLALLLELRASRARTRATRAEP